MKKSLFIVFILFATTLISAQNSSIINTGIIEPTNTVGYFKESFIHHLNSLPNEFFLSVVATGTTEYFGISNTTQNRKYISRIGVNGQPVWNAIMYGADNLLLLNSSQDVVCVDKDDNVYILCRPNAAGATFVDALGTEISFNPDFQKLIKLNKDGKLLWNKDFRANSAGISTHNNGDIYLYGENLEIDFSQPIQPTSLVKMNCIDGNILHKIDFNQPVYQFFPVFDNNDNLYVFTEPMTVFGDENYYFSTGNLDIPLNEDGNNSLMIKFDTSGNPVFGKNFYSIISYTGSGGWINSASFDGTDIIVTGNVYTNNVTNPFVGMDGNTITNIYGKNYQGIIAKIDLAGNVKWEKSLQSPNNLGPGMYTNIMLDNEKNIYAYLTFKSKINFDNTEYNFDGSPETKVISKWDNNGNLFYFQNVDNSGNNFQNVAYYNYIDVVGNDKLNVLGYTDNSNFLNFPLHNTATPKLYIAAFQSENMGSIENQAQKFTISPNPASEFINIETQAKISKIEIFDISGKLVKTINGENKNIYVSFLNNGLYIVRIHTENGIVNSKFIKN